MRIQIWLDAEGPPAGRVTRDSSPDDFDEAVPAVPFEGWLGLLRVLSDLIVADDARPL